MYLMIKSVKSLLLLLNRFQSHHLYFRDCICQLRSRFKFCNLHQKFCNLHQKFRNFHQKFHNFHQVPLTFFILMWKNKIKIHCQCRVNIYVHWCSSLFTSMFIDVHLCLHLCSSDYVHLLCLCSSDYVHFYLHLCSSVFIRCSSNVHHMFINVHRKSQYGRTLSWLGHPGRHRTLSQPLDLWTIYEYERRDPRPPVFWVKKLN